MKVTVTFGKVRVIVPCGNGNLRVRDLMELAVTRYKKATGKPANDWVTIHNLKIAKDEGILYPDDKLTDVADDREQITAIFEEQCPYLPHHNGGDGTSASSIGTDSPDIFRGRQDSQSPEYGCNDVEITNCVSDGLVPLHVRRGSEPTLNSSPGKCTDHSKRWSTTAALSNGHLKHSRNSQDDSSDDSDIPAEREEGNGEEKFLNRFSRSPGRLSVVRNDLELYCWENRSEKQQERKEPLGGSGSSSDRQSPERDDSDSEEEKEIIIVLKKEMGPLGIHVIPNYDLNGRERGLIIQGIEQCGRIYYDGRISVGDCIVEINGHRLHHVNFQKAQDIFKKAMEAEEIRLCLLKGLPNFSSSISKKSPPPIYPKPSSYINNHAKIYKEENDEMVTPEHNHSRGPIRISNTLTSNTRKIGRKIHIQLNKGSCGLGFSVTTRDNPAGKNCPIYIKNILPHGAAIEDGRLKPGDRLLEVNGIEMTGRSQNDVVTMLRGIPSGETVNLLVSRQTADPCSPSPSLPRALPPEKAEDEKCNILGKQREILIFEIPLNDTGSAGLGVSVKGKTSTALDSTTDLGIFVKSVIHGGAASKDGRLLPNDQLVNINGTSLLGMTNTQAMETLRRAMTQGESPNPHAIVLTVARRVPSSENLNLSYTGCHTRSDSLISGSGESDGSATILGGYTANCNSHPSVFLETKVQNNSPKNSSMQEEEGRKFSLTSRHPIIDYLMGQTPKSDFNISENFSESTLLVQPVTPINSNPKTLSRTDSNESSNQAELRNVPILERSSNKDGEESQTPELNTRHISMSHNQKNLNDEEFEFSRDGFGRQSMSEKRHAHLDVKNTDTYQRNKKAREEREKWRNRISKEYLSFSNEQIRDRTKWDFQKCENNDTGSSLGMRKSSSLESLQTVLQEIHKEENAAKLLPKYPSQAAKGRGCTNESFRAAVDRSYETVHKGTMETLDEDTENFSAEKASEFANDSAITDDLPHDMLHPYRIKMNNSKKKKIFKGIGSMFKFGKNRKTDSSRKNTQDLLKQEAEKLRARWAAQEEYERIQEHYKRFVEQQKREQKMGNHTFSTPVLPSLHSHFLPSPHQRQRMQFLQSHYQQSCYDDEQDNWNEQETKEILVRQPSLPLFSHRRFQTQWRQESPEIHRTQPPTIRRTQSLRYAGRQQARSASASRSHSPKIDVYREMERAGSRTGIADPKIYEHYMSHDNSPRNKSPHQKFSNSPLNCYKNQNIITRSSRRTSQNVKSSSSSDELDCKSPLNRTSVYKSERLSSSRSKRITETPKLKNSIYSDSSPYHTPTSKIAGNYSQTDRIQHRITGSKV